MLRMLLPSPPLPQRQRRQTGVRVLVLLLLALLAVDNKCTELDDGEDSSSSSSSSPSSPSIKTFSNTQSIIELVGPKKYVALGGNDLIISYRLSPSLASSPTSTTLSSSPSATSQHSSSGGRRGAKPANPQPGLSSSSSGPITAGRRKLIMYLTLEDERIGESFDDESETLITKQVLTQPPVTAWHEVHFDCGWIVHGVNYKVTLMEELEPQQQQSNRTRFFIASLIIHADYPSIDFEVPRRLESYTASAPISIGLTRTLCKPKLPLPATQLTLNLCKQESDESGSDDSSKDVSNYPEHEDCERVFAVLASNPLDQLQKEGQITMTVGCSLWGRSGHFRVQLGRYFSTRFHGANHKGNRTWIARSEPIKVDWSSRFRVGFTENRKSIIPCPETESVKLEIDYPSCVINGLDKIRVYGYETLPLPSMLAPRRLSYIREELIPSNTHRLSFSCALFPQRLPRYCFQYINTAVDGSVAVVVEECIPTLPPDQFSDGGWGPWSAWSPCSTSCGKDGRRFRYRFCDSPLPSFGANYCQGDSIEESECDNLSDCAPPKRKPFDIASIYEDDEYLDPDDDNGSGEAGERQENKAAPFLHINNLNYTSGCECGCLLHDLVPGFNYSLIVTLSPSQSYCEDEDEEEHHNLKWILHAKGDGNRIRFLIVGVDLQCMTLSFRDGNTTDSNLLEVMTMSTQYSLLQPSTPAIKQEQASRNDMDNRNITADAKEKKEESRRLKSLLHIIESTGASLSIATSESTRNCSTTPTVYFVAYYHIVPSAPQSKHVAAPGAAAAAGIAERHSKEWNLYEFWSFLVIKFVLTFFVIIILFTTFGGFATKMYRRAKYKKLTWIVTDDDRMNESQSETESGSEDEERDCRGRQRHRGMGDEGEEYDQLMSNGSRNTSVTLMSFDQSYWKQLRTLRLKHFLLAPRRKYVLTKVKSYPSTPVHGKQIKLAFRSKALDDEGNRREGFKDATTCGSRDGAGDCDNYDKNGQDLMGSKTVNDSHPTNSESRLDWRHKKELNRLTSLSDSNLKNIKRVNLRDIIRDECCDWDEDEMEFERRRIVQCYRSRRSGSSRPSSIIIVRSKSSNVPIMPHALSTLPTCNKKFCVAGARNASVGLCLGTCGNESGGGGDRLRNNKCNCSCTTRIINDINTRARSTKRTDEEENSEERRGKRSAVMAIMKRSVRREENEKIRKEKENLKRRGIEMSQIMSKEQCAYARVHQDESAGAKSEYKAGNGLGSRSGTPATTTSTSSGGTCSLSGKSRKSKHKIRVQQGFDSESNLPYSIKNSSGYLCSVGHGESRDTDLNDMDDDDEQDFEMDYYDYDASNAANIPGSLFGMEPAFVLWNSEMFSQDQNDGEGEGDHITGSQTTDELPGTMSSTTNTNYDNDGFCCSVDTMTDNGEEDEEMLELITTTTDSNLSSGSTAAPAPINTAVYFRRNTPSTELLELQQSRNKQQTQLRMPKVREISLDTLKYVDDAEFDEEV